MKDFIWTSEDSVGVEIIDDQHKRFVDIINELNAAIAQTKTRDMLTGIFSELMGYMDIHFATEEKYFDEYNYPESEAHKKAHAEFKKGITKIYEDYVDNLEVLSFTLIDYLENWLLKHTKNMDKRYTKCFNDHGLK